MVETKKRNYKLIRHMWRLSKKPKLLALIGACLLTIIGACINNYFQTQAWEKEKQHQIFQSEANQRKEFFNDLTELMNRRKFLILKVFRTAKGVSEGNLDDVWNSYYESVEAWNVLLMQNKIGITHYIGNRMASKFEDQDDSETAFDKAFNSEIPKTIHGHFLRTHRIVKLYMLCAKNNCDQSIKEDLNKQFGLAYPALVDAIKKFTTEAMEIIYSNPKFFK